MNQQDITQIEALSRREAQLQIEEDLAFQQRDWRVQRVGWIGLALLITAALLGLFGTGPLSDSIIRGDGLELRYERFGRFDRLTRLRFELIGETQETTRLSIGRPYLDAVQIEQITPVPARVEARPDRLVYEFPRHGPTAIIFYVKPDNIGIITGQAQVNKAAPLSFKQFIYP
jgi:hypothetical protein